MKKNKKGKRKLNFYRIISFLLLLVSACFTGIIFYADLLPTKYLAIVISILAIFNILNIWLLNMKKLKNIIKRMISGILIILMIIMILAGFYIYRTINVLNSNGDSKYKLEHYSVITLSSSGYKELTDIKNKNVGYYEKSAGNKSAIEHLNSKIDLKLDSYDSADLLMNDLLNNEVDAILLEDAIVKILKEELDDFEGSTKVIYTFTVKVKSESTLKDVDVTKGAFAIYISGIDTYGEISSVSRSDVNILMVVNPKTKQILLVSMPRDYYVQLYNTTGSRDKLTHAGIYGIDMSVKTVEQLLDVDINYYIKVNFTSVIDIVNALGGLDVYSEYTFVSYSGYSFKKGYNSVNGEQALDFARTRKAFIDGDRQRGKNQQALIEAIIRKATNKFIITKYNSLLSAINGKYQTNMGTKKITSLIKMQLNDMSPWNITSYSLKGFDSKNYTYTYNQLLYVMEPDEDSVNQAISMIKQVLNGEVLDGSYKEELKSSNKVTQVPKPVVNNKPTNSTLNNEKNSTETPIEQDSNNNDETVVEDDNPKDDNSEEKTIEDEENESLEPASGTEDGNTGQKVVEFS